MLSRMLTLADGGSLFALKQKGNLSHVESLYNPGNFFAEVHILVFDKKDLSIQLNNPTLKVHYLSHFPKGKWGLLLSLPFLLWQTIRIIRRYKIQIIRSRNAYMAGLLGVLAAKCMRIPLVVSLGGDNRLAQQLLGYYYGGSRFLSFFLEEFSLRRASRVFCVNQFTRNYAIGLGVLPVRTSIVPHRLDFQLSDFQCDYTSARKKLSLDLETPLIVTVGRLERDKQVDKVVASISLVQQKYPHAKFIFVGDGRLRKELEEEVVKNNLMEMVQFVGFQPRREVINYLAAATLVCIPMSGFVIYEAVAAQKPIVTFDVEWHSEFIEHKQTGLLIKNRDVVQLAEGIIHLLDNPELQSKLAANAYKKLQKQFDQTLLIEKEIAAYQGL